MDYITAEQFLKQPEKVQNEFISWIAFSGKNISNSLVLSDGKVHLYKQVINIKNHGEIIPLLSETQLRRFIEEKTKENIKPSLYCKYCLLYKLIQNDVDLLQAYWQVACKMAEWLKKTRSK